MTSRSLWRTMGEADSKEYLRVTCKYPNLRSLARTDTHTSKLIHKSVIQSITKWHLTDASHSDHCMGRRKCHLIHVGQDILKNNTVKIRRYISGWTHDFQPWNKLHWCLKLQSNGNVCLYQLPIWNALLFIAS